ncbi:MAG: hypothetical protein IT356_07240 [Gemmatimonadaceae bacterium]|nr:hypothetical protein [Gemmatimonadaceae bacterium]
MADVKFPPKGQLAKIKERLRAGTLTPQDVKQLEKIVIATEKAAAALRAAVVE